MNKVITKVFSVSEKTREMMIDYYDEFKREKTPPYAIFQADDGDTVVTLYNSSKVVFQGVDADLAADFWIETEKINSNNADVTTSDNSKKDNTIERKIPLRINSIGSDEVGTGDYFGPIVVTASYVSKDNIDFLLELGIKDSKKMSDDKIKKIVPQIIKRIPYNSFILTNKKYNESSSINLNKMKAILHNKVLFHFACNKDKYPYDYIVIDQFENPKKFYEHINEASYKVYNVTFLTKAEDQCLSVAVSSIISRYIFLREMEKLSKELDINLPKGANPQVDLVGREIVKRYGENKLNEIAKINFKNTKKIME